MTLQTKDGKLIIVSGSSRCGKTAKTERLARKFKTVFVWDIENQWSKLKGYKKINTLQGLKSVVKSGLVGKFAFVCDGQDLKGDYEAFCACVMYYGMYHGECAVVAEELADVTSTAKAGQDWGMLCRRGLKRGITIFAISQRWAEADKTALGNATEFYLFRMATVSDMRYMVEKTGITLARLQQLAPLEFLHYDTYTKAVTGGKLTF